METLQRPYGDERRRLEEFAAELDCAAPCSGSVSVLTRTRSHGAHWPADR